jgi:hypothetical protein
MLRFCTEINRCFIPRKLFGKIINLSFYSTAIKIPFEDSTEFCHIKLKKSTFTFTSFRSQFPQLPVVNVKHNTVELTAFYSDNSENVSGARTKLHNSIICSCLYLRQIRVVIFTNLTTSFERNKFI